MEKIFFKGSRWRRWVIMGALVSLIPAKGLYAQFQGPVYVEDTTVRVYAGGTLQGLAWSGGMNNPQFAMGDLDHDGVNDMVVFEAVNARVKTFLNKGTPGNPRYVYAPQYAANFPTISDYLILADYDRDGIADLFHMGEGISRVGFAVFKGYYNANNELSFQFYKTLWYSNDLLGIPPVNAYVNPSDIPSIVDLDGDGDLDFVSYGNFYNQPMYYQNLQVEDHLPTDSIRIRLADWCWGKMQHGNGIDRSYRLGISCDDVNRYLQRPSRDNPRSGNKVTHSGDALCLFDADGDGDMDYLAGNVSFNDMVFLRNGRKEFLKNVDSMVYQDTIWQSTLGGKKIDLPQWPAAYWLDADGDGRKDILISPHAAYTSENYKCVWYYRNTGSNNPSGSGYVFQKDTFLIENMIDVGSAAYPMLYDYNKDGRPDLFIGSDGYYQPGGSFRSRLSYYENTSDSAETSFTLVSKDLLNVFAANVRGSAPTMGDLDNDGLDDLVLGHSDGTLSFYRNTAASDAVQPVWQRMGKLKDRMGAEINLGGNAMPFIYDMNKDGLADLIIGNMNGTIRYYRNIGGGAAGQPKLEKENDSLGAIVVNEYYGKSAPFIGRMDNTTRDYLVVGSDIGNIYRFTDFQKGNVRIPYTRLDSNYSYINAGNHTALTIGDIDNDGKYEMIVGNEFGGVNIYRQALDVDTMLKPIPSNMGEIVETAGLLQLYPNPATDVLYLGLSGMEFSENPHIVICNSMGQVQRTVTREKNKANVGLDISFLPPGVYLCRIDSGGCVQSGTFIKK